MYSLGYLGRLWQQFVLALYFFSFLYYINILQCILCSYILFIFLNICPPRSHKIIILLFLGSLGHPQEPSYRGKWPRHHKQTDDRADLGLPRNEIAGSNRGSGIATAAVHYIALIECYEDFKRGEDRSGYKLPSSRDPWISAGHLTCSCQIGGVGTLKPAMYIYNGVALKRTSRQHSVQSLLG